MMLKTEFKTKKVLCESDAIHKTIKDIEYRWLESLMTRLGIPKIMIDRRERGELGNAAWSNYLFDNYKISIDKNLSTEQVKVYKYLDGDVKQLAEWNIPEKVKRLDEKHPYYELRLNYWQLL